MPKRRLPHESITEDRVVAMCMRTARTVDNPGMCLACGSEQDGCDPDAEGDTCDECGESCVMGAEQILIAGAYHPTPAGVARTPADLPSTTIDIEDET